ncbi:MAG: DUF3078 domain-containing protein [Tannerellaceae bacterium]
MRVLLVTLAIIFANSFSHNLVAQETNTTTNEELAPDQYPELEKIPTLMQVHEQENLNYKPQIAPTAVAIEGFIPEQKLEISREALYWINKRLEPWEEFDRYVTFQDTVIVNPLFLPFVFRSKSIADTMTWAPIRYHEQEFPQTSWIKTDTLFKERLIVQRFRDTAYDYIVQNNRDDIKYAQSFFPKGGDFVKPIIIEGKKPEEILTVDNTSDLDQVTAPVKFIPERRYWTSSMNSSLQFSQNYISPNWYKGGSSNINLLSRNFFRYDYNRDKVQFVNEMEWKVSFFNAPKDSLRSFKIGDDVLRIYSNLGYKAFSKWYYTVNCDFNTLVFKNYIENTNTLRAAFLSPMILKLGLGMKYSTGKASERVKGRNYNFNINLDPLALSYKYIANKNVDVVQHGIPEGEKHLTQIGSNIRAELNFNINKNISFYSRASYFTNYEKIEIENENRLNMAISRYFSTMISITLRYDDSVPLNEDFKTHLQVNELLSFGFNYKW